MATVCRLLLLVAIITLVIPEAGQCGCNMSVSVAMTLQCLNTVQSSRTIKIRKKLIKQNTGVARGSAMDARAVPKGEKNGVIYWGKL